MEKIYIINDGQNPLIKDFEYPKIDYAERRTASDFHQYVLSIFDTYEIDKLIIPIRLGNTNRSEFPGLTLGLHIRLTSEIGSKRFIPLIFIGEEDLEDVLLLTQDNMYNPAYLLTTSGSVYTNDMPKANAFILAQNAVTDYQKEVLDHLKILSLTEEEGGKHSLANIWGVLRLDKLLSLKAIPASSDTYLKTLDLYFKYLCAFHVEKRQAYVDLDPLKCKDKRILLIDDEANIGWANVFTSIFKGAHFEFIDFKGKSFEEAFKEAEKRSLEEDWDLILLDLRLNPSKEDLPNQLLKTTEYTGARLLKKIKNYNEGIQVIILTASNKAWNMKKLLDEKADGYYIKESPEFNFSDNHTMENYKNLKQEITDCFKLNYLKPIFEIHKQCNKFIEKNAASKNTNIQSFYLRAITSLEVSFELLKKSSTEYKYFNLSFFTYFQIIEDFVSMYENFSHEKLTGDCIVNGQQVIEGATKTWQLKFIKKGVLEYDYLELGSEVNSNSVSTLAKVSFVLAFKYGKGNDFLKSWARMNYLRNTKAVHSNTKDYVTPGDIKELVDFVKFIILNS